MFQSQFPTVQWGVATEPSNNNPETSITFPISFPSNCFAVIPTSTFNGNANFYGISVISKSLANAKLKSGDYGGDNVYWIAIGN